MTETLFSIHSITRYLVLIAAVVAIVTALLTWARVAVPPRLEQATARAFVGLLDLQVLLGVLVIVTGFPFYGALTGHIFMMLLAAGAAHAGVVLSRKRTERRSAAGARLIGFAIALVLIVGGVMAIQRPLL